MKQVYSWPPSSRTPAAMTLAWGAKVRGRWRLPGPIFFQAAEGQGGFFAPWPVERRFCFVGIRWNVVKVINFDRPLHLAPHLIGHGGVAEPPAPAITRADMNAQFSGDAQRRARQTEQKGGENPVGEGALAAVQECAREIIEGALAGLLSTAVALQSRLVVISAPRTDMVALTSGALQEPIFPAQRMDIGLTHFGVEEFVEMRHNRHSCASPLITSSGKNRIGDSQ